MNRRQFLAGALGAVAIPWLNARAAGAEARRGPNVIIIYGDDVGYGDVGAYGATMIPTPNIDRMAVEGLRFTDAHCAAATCTPSRYALLTGEMAFRKKGTGVLPGDANMAIAPEQFTLADVFRNAGYRTGAVGKWHLGLGNGPIDWNGVVQPGANDLGFDYTFLLPATNDRVPCVYIEDGRVVNSDPGDPISVSYGAPLSADTPGTAYPDGKVNPEAMTYYPSTHGHNNSVINGIGRIGYMKGGKQALWNDESMADVLLEKAAAFIEKNREQPFFLYFCSQDIHVPRAPHPRFHGKSDLGYRGDAMVQLDWTVGEILKSLARHGLDEDTLVIFSSDNGPVYDDGYRDGTTVHTSTAEADRGHDGSGAYRGGKYQIYEGGTRIPFILRWPGTIQSGVSDALVTQVDLLASFAAMLGQSIPEKAAADSRDCLDTFLGRDSQGSPLILEQANRLAIRRGPWKYIEAGPKNKGEAELYRVETDIAEQHNVIAEHSAVAEELAALLKTCKQNGLRQMPSPGA